MSQMYTRCPELSSDGPNANRLCSNGLCSRGLGSHRVLTDCDPTDCVLADCVLSNGLCSHGLYSVGLCSNGLYAHGLCSNGLCSNVRSMGQFVVQVQGFRQRSRRAWGRRLLCCTPASDQLTQKPCTASSHGSSLTLSVPHGRCKR